MWFHLIVYFLFISSQYNSLPNGAPKCAINATVIEKGHGTPSDPKAGFYLNVKRSNDSMWIIKIQNSMNRTAFKGVLMYVVGKDPKDHLGMFVNLNMSKYKFQTRICNNLGFKGDKHSTITHRNPDSVSIDSNLNVFYWKPLWKDKMKKGPFVIKAVVATSPSPWQVLEVAPIKLGKQMAPECNKCENPKKMPKHKCKWKSPMKY